MMNLNCIATRYPYAVHSPPVLPKRCVIVTYLDAVAYRRAYIWRAALSPWGRWRSGRTAGSSDRCDTPYARTHTYRTRTSTGTQKHGISIDARPDGRYWRDRRGPDPWLVGTTAKPSFRAGILPDFGMGIQASGNDRCGAYHVWKIRKMASCTTKVQLRCYWLFMMWNVKMSLTNDVEVGPQSNSIPSSGFITRDICQNNNESQI